jgi:hypothetical protein
LAGIKSEYLAPGRNASESAPKTLSGSNALATRALLVSLFTEGLSRPKAFSMARLFNLTDGVG